MTPDKARMENVLLISVNLLFCFFLNGVRNKKERGKRVRRRGRHMHREREKQTQTESDSKTYRHTV